MAKQRRTIGTGITARTAEIYSGDDDMPAAFAAFAERWNAALGEADGSQFGAVVSDAERQCRRILEAAGAAAPFEADSAEHYARRILRAIASSSGHIARGDADAAARAALDVGRLCTEAHMKGLWEDHALRGEKLATKLKENAARKNTRAQAEAARRSAQWQTMAESLWATNRHLSKSAVAEIIGKRTGGNVSTIRHGIVRKVK